MIVLKIFCIIGGFGVCAYGGYKFSTKYNARERYFAEALELCEGIRSDINFVHLMLRPILEKYGDSFKSFLKAQLAGTAALLDDGRLLTEAGLKEYIPQGHLTADEYDTVIRFFNTLGKSDAENQTASLESFKAAFKKYHDDAAEKKKKYSSVYWKLGLLAGAALAVFII